MKLLSESQLAEAISLFHVGEPIIFPTETVYGLGAPLFNEKAIAKIFSIKGRSFQNPLIAHVVSIAQVEEIAEQIPPLFYQLAERFWPGPLTIVLRKKSCISSLVSGGTESIGVRVTPHPVARHLIEAAGQPLVATSANLSGQPSPASRQQVIDQLGDRVVAFLDGPPAPAGVVSTVISLIEGTPELLRSGAIDFATICKSAY
jgi:L-threonylcarbamoyladenylate synthase